MELEIIPPHRKACTTFNIHIIKIDSPHVQVSDFWRLHGRLPGRLYMHEVFEEVFKENFACMKFSKTWNLKLSSASTHSDMFTGWSDSSSEHNLEKSKSFKQREVTKWKKIRHENLPKHSDLLIYPNYRRAILLSKKRGLVVVLRDQIHKEQWHTTDLSYLSPMFHLNSDV